MLPIVLQLAGRGRLDRAIRRLEQKEHLRQKKNHKKENKKRENVDNAAITKKKVINNLIYCSETITDIDIEDPSRGLEMVDVPVLNGGNSGDIGGNFDGDMMVTIDFDKYNARSLFQENILWHDSAMNAFAAGLMSELKYMSLNSNMPKIHFDICFLNYYQFRPTPEFDEYPIPKYSDVVFGFMQYMEHLDDGNIVNEHWLLVRIIKKNREVYFFDSGTEPADDTYFEDLKHRALYAIVGYGWCKIENINLQRYNTKEEWIKAKTNKKIGILDIN